MATVKAILECTYKIDHISIVTYPRPLNLVSFLATSWCHFQHYRVFDCGDASHFVSLPIEVFNFSLKFLKFSLQSKHINPSYDSWNLKSD